jgi:GH18 family chitinase
MYYNGIPTIKNKTQLAMKQAAGIMIWELMYDLPGRKSLLNAINQAASANKY